MTYRQLKAEPNFIAALEIAMRNRPRFSRKQIETVVREYKLVVGSLTSLEVPPELDVSLRFKYTINDGQDVSFEVHSTTNVGKLAQKLEAMILGFHPWVPSIDDGDFDSSMIKCMFDNACKMAGNPNQLIPVAC